MSMKTLFAGICMTLLAFSFTTFAAEEGNPGMTMDIVATAAAHAELSTLADFVIMSDKETTLAGTGTYTVFGPSDDAFAALDTGFVSYLGSADGAADLGFILSHHIVAGSVLASDITDGATMTTLAGTELSFAVSGDLVSVNGATIVTANIEASNGLIHVLDSVLLPHEETGGEGGDRVHNDYAKCLASGGYWVQQKCWYPPKSEDLPTYNDPDSDDDGLADESEQTTGDVDRVPGSYVPQHAQDAISYLHANGLTRFATVATFMGDQSLRRDEAAAFFARFSRDVLGMDVASDATGCDFTDLATAHDDLLGEIDAACRLGLFKGHAGTFMPTDVFSNAHAVTVLVRLLDGVQEEPADNWAANYHSKAQALGLTASLSADAAANLYHPITREDVAKMIEAASVVIQEVTLSKELDKSSPKLAE